LKKNVKVLYVDNWLKKVQEIQNELKFQNLIIVTSKGTVRRNNLEKVIDSSSIYYGIKENPTYEDCQVALDFIYNKNFDSVLAIGGGSVLDTAKVILAALKYNQYNLATLLSFENEVKLKNKIPSIFIPTTHGTGSEVTKWGTIWDIRKGKKYSISNNNLYPDFALLDGSLTITLPIKVSVATTLDALSHSFEAIWNKNATFDSINLATEAISIIVKHIDSIINGNNTIVVKKQLLHASCLAGEAISLTKTAAAHSMSYPLTLFHNIPHGIAASFFINDFIDMCYDHIYDSAKNILVKCGFKNITRLKNEILKLLVVINDVIKSILLSVEKSSTIIISQLQ